MKIIQNKDTIIALRKNQTEVETKIEKLEEKYILEEVDKALYQKFSAKYKQEKVEIQKVFDEVSTKSSNLQEFIEYTLSISLKLDSYWENLDFRTKPKLQYLGFSEGCIRQQNMAV